MEGINGGGALSILLLSKTWAINIHGIPTILPPNKFILNKQRNEQTEKIMGNRKLLNENTKEK